MEVLYHLSYSPEERLNLAVDLAHPGTADQRERPDRGRSARPSDRPTKPASWRAAAAKKSAFAPITLWNWPNSSKLTIPKIALHATSPRTTTGSGTPANVS